MATGETLKANGLVIVDQLMRSSTRLYAHPRALDHPEKRARIETVVLLLRSVLDARQRVMLEVNVPAEKLDAVIAVLPSMREPTMAPLHGDQGFALKAAVPRADLPRVIPAIKARGGTDIVVTALAQIVA
jgi:ATP phosphoribosyltransferase-like protein